MIGVVAADSSEIEAIHQALELLEACSVPYETLIASTAVTPDDLHSWTRGARDRGLQVILAVAGNDRFLPQAVAAHTLLPIIGIPLIEHPDQEGASLGLLTNSADGIPVGTTGVGSPRNAAVFAIEILARHDRRWESSILKFREHLRETFKTRAGRDVDEAPPRTTSSSSMGGEEALKPVQRPSAPHPHLKDPTGRKEDPPPGQASPPPSDPAEESATAAAFGHVRRPEIPHTDKPGLKREAQHVGRVQIDPDIIAVDDVENATDCLLDGGIVAIPTDTVYGLAVDATNPDAVDALYELKGREADKPIAVFIESQRQLAALVRNLTGDIKQMLEAFWPGPLTVVFERRSSDFDYLAPGNTIGVRLPDQSTALALLQELRRPIACTSANPSGAPPARSGEEVEQYFGRDVHMILDAGKLAHTPPSTVIDVTSSPYRLLREGPISKSQLSAILGDLLEGDESD